MPRASAAPPTFDALAERAAKIAPRLVRKRLTVATMESCTGGLLAAVLTANAGSSGFYAGGGVVYANDAKTALAGVPPDLIHAHGAVSPVVAAALARGAREELRAGVGLGITGIAGPDGGTPAKPVGLVYVAVESDRTSAVRTCRLAFDRAGNRLASVAAALDLLEEAVK